VQFHRGPGELLLQIRAAENGMAVEGLHDLAEEVLLGLRVARVVATRERRDQVVQAQRQGRALN
jgi:hypothetical protein